MNDRELFERLRREADEHTPDVKVDVRAARVQPPQGEVVAAARSRKAALISVLSALLGIILLLAILLPVLLGGGGGGKYGTLVISINPSAEFTIEDGKVTRTRALNRDAAILLEGNTWDGLTAEDACLTFAQLAEKRNLIGADGVRIHASGKDGNSIAASVHGALDALFAVGDLDEAALASLLGSYDEEEMERFEAYVTHSYSAKKTEYLERAKALLTTYRADLLALDLADRAAAEAFNTKYLLLGEDFLIEFDDDDEDEILEDLLEEYEEISALLARDPDEAFEELFEGFLELMEEDYDD